MKKFSIWCDTYFMDMETLKDWEAETRDFLMDGCEDEPTDYEIYERIQEENSLFYADEHAQLAEIDLPENIICIADLGLWDGNRCGYREFDDLADCMQTSCDYAEWYVDQYGNFRGTGVHHDGTNSYLYRMWKPGLSDEQRENFMWKIYTGKVTPADISRYTVRLGDYIGAIYGWKFCGKAPACVKA